MNLPIMLTRSGVVWLSRSMVGTINSSMSTENNQSLAIRLFHHHLTNVRILVLRHAGVDAVGEESQGAVVPDGVPGEETGVEIPVNNLDGDPVLRVTLLQLAFIKKW